MDEEQFMMQIMAGIDEAEVMTVFFPLLRRALVVDTRSNRQVGPLIEVMPQAGSMEERVAMIERKRPQFGRIHGILGVPWVKTINCFVEVGILGRIEQRLVASEMSRDEADRVCTAALNELRQAEYKEMVAMIKGDGYEALWERERDED